MPPGVGIPSVPALWLPAPSAQSGGASLFLCRVCLQLPPTPVVAAPPIRPLTLCLSAADPVCVHPACACVLVFGEERTCLPCNMWLEKSCMPAVFCPVCCWCTGNAPQAAVPVKLKPCSTSSSSLKTMTQPSVNCPKAKQTTQMQALQNNCCTAAGTDVINKTSCSRQ